MTGCGIEGVQWSDWLVITGFGWEIPDILRGVDVDLLMLRLRV